MTRDAQFSLEVDGTRCDAHGMCVLVCPELIELDPWGYALVRAQPITDARTLRRARRAVAACPAGALFLRASQDEKNGALVRDDARVFRARRAPVGHRQAGSGDDL